MTGEELKQIRESKNLGKKDFALSLGITAMLEGRYESGGIMIPERIEQAVRSLYVEKPAPASDKAPAPKKKAGRKKSAKAFAPVVIIQSLLGGEISTEDLLEKINAAAPDAETVYIKPEENKAYWVSEEDSGSVDLW